MDSALEFTDPMRVFGSVRARDVRSLAAPVLNVLVPEGTTLVSEDEELGTFFVIRSGTAKISRAARALGMLDPGDCFGEIDPAAPCPQPFTIVAGSQMRLLAFSSLGIGRLCAAIPGARERILRSLPQPFSGRAAAGALSERGGVEHGDHAMIGGDPPEPAHQSQCPGDRLARGSRPSRKLVLRQR